MDSWQSGAAAVGNGSNGIMVATQTIDAVMASATTQVDVPKQKLNQVMNSLQKTLGLLHQLNLSVPSFSAASQLPLLHRILIDRGKNPDEFTKDVISIRIAKNQITKGKADAFKGLRKHLLEELERTFPDEVESYREMRAASATEQKRLAQAQSLMLNGDLKVKPEP